MFHISRVVAAAACAAFIATGVALAQNAPPPQPAMTPQAKSPKNPSKCKTKPNGCPKRKKSKTAAPPPAGGTMPQPAPTH